MKKQNLIKRLGNKEKDLFYFKHLLPLDCKKVVEPFAGSFAIIREFYKDYTKYNFHINDLDNNLYYIYTHIDEYIECLKALNGVHNLKTTNQIKTAINNCGYNVCITDYIIQHNIILGMLRLPRQINVNQDHIDILKNAIVTNKDYSEIFHQYKYDGDAFLFLDPPYLFSDNSGYIPQSNKQDVTGISIAIKYFIDNCKCKVMLIINDLHILRYLFDGYIKSQYTKRYAMSGNNSNHLIITNY